MANEHFKRDGNRVTAVGGVTNDANLELVTFRVDAATKRLLVSAVITGGASSGTEYTEGDVDATITGGAIMWEDTSDTLRAVSAVKPLPVNIVAGSSSGTEYTEDVAAAADPVGTVPILVRKDTPATTVSTDGDNIAQRGTNYGAAYVTLLDTGGSPVSVGGGTQYTEDAAAAADPIGTMNIAVRADALAAVTSTDGDNIALRSTNKGELYVKQTDAVPVTDNGGNLSIDDGGNSITVDGTVAVSGTVTVDSELTTADLDTGAGTDTRAVVGLVGSKSGGGVLIPGDATAGLKVDLGADNDVTVTSGTITTVTNVVHVDDNAGSLTVDNGGTFAVQDSEKVADNAGFTDGTTKVLPAGFIFDEVAGTALTENDAAAGRIDAKRAQVGVIEDATTRGQRAAVSAAGALKVDGSAATQPISGTVTAVGDIASGSADSGNPVKVSGKYNLTKPTFADGQRGDIQIDTRGSLHVTPGFANGTNLFAGLVDNADAVAVTAVATRLAVSSRNYMYNGASFDRMTGDTTNGLDVDVTRLPALVAGAALIGKVGLDQTTPGTTNAVSIAQLGANTVLTGNGVTGTGSQRVTVASDNTPFAVKTDQTTHGTTDLVAADITKVAGAAISQGHGTAAAAIRVELPSDGTGVVNAAQSGTWTVQPGNTANTTPWLATPAPATSGGLSKFHLISAGTTNATNIKASAGQVYGWAIFNSTSSIKYVKFHNTAGSPTAGAGVTDTIMVPASSGTNVEFSMGIPFATGIAITTVTGAADTDAVAVAASDLIINIYYK